MSTSRPLLTQREAAAACGVSRTTIRRRREAGDLPGCTLHPEQGWLIPVEALLVAGFRLNAPTDAPNTGDSVDTAKSPCTDHDGAPPPVGDDQDAAALRTEIERLRHEHALALKDAELAQKLAEQKASHLEVQLAERGEHIESLQRALLALTPAPERAAIPPAAAPTGSVPVVPEQPTAPEDAQEAPARRRWWRGRR